MRNVLEILIANIGAHLSDDTQSRLVSGELHSGKVRRAKRHLSKCWRCRSRHEELERAAMGFVELHKRLITPNPPETAQWREMFLARLDEAAAEEPSASWSRLLPHFRLASLANMNPLLASAAVILVASVVLFLIWQRSAPSVSAKEFLERAETSDNNSSRSDEPGVIYQKVRIRAPHVSVERDLYRDRKGQRRPKSEPVGAEFTPLKAKLSVAGVNWDEPLSASSYKAWHDNQREETDQVRRSGNNLLTVTTKTFGGLVVQESLTVRQEDFHPVKRTVELLDVGTVEIAEVNYAVLNWNAVNENLFEPLTPPMLASPFVQARVAPVTPAVPTPAQLLDAELQARLALNRLNADAGEQIRVARTNAEVEVKGVVETDQRKQEIVSQLRSIPHVNSSILSAEELSSHPPSPSDVTSIQQYELVGRSSPLEQYMKEKGFSREDLSRMSRRLLDACLAVQRESSALAELRDRFGFKEQLSSPSRAVLNELVGNHLASISAALDEEAATLRELGFTPADGTPTEVGDANALERKARANQLVCQELIAGGAEQPRSAATIASDFFASVNAMRFVVKNFRSQFTGQ